MHPAQDGGTPMTGKDKEHNSSKVRCGLGR